MFRHIVLFRVRDDVADPEVFEAISALRSLEEGSGAVSWRIELSTDTRKGRVIVEDASFASRENFNRFRSSEAHMTIAEQLSLIADWWIGDYDYDYETE